MTTKNKVNIDTQIIDLGCMPTLIITLIYSRYRLLKEFVEFKISFCLGGLLVKICVWDTSYFLIKSKFGKTVEHSKSIEHSQKELIVHAKAQHVGHSKVAEGQNVECFKIFECSCQDTAFWTLNIVQHSEKFVEHSMKELKIESHQRPFCAALPKWFRGIFLICNEQGTWSAW